MGYDRRFLSKETMRWCGQVFAAAGITASLVNKSSAEDGMKTVAMAFGGDASEGRFIVASSPDSGISEPGQLAGSKIGISENTMMASTSIWTIFWKRST